MHILPLVLGLIGVAAFADENSDTREPREYFFTQTFGDLPEELDEVKKSGKAGLLLFYEQEGCPYCQRMMQTVFNQRRVQDWYAEHFLSITVDIRGDVELRDIDGITLPSKVFAQHRKVNFSPVISFLDLNGAEIFRKSGMISNPEEFLLMGRYITEGRYTDTVFADYLEEKGFDSNGDVLLTPAMNN